MIDDRTALACLKRAHRLKEIATPVGSMHSYWDEIFDLDALAKGRPTIASEDEILSWLEDKDFINESD